MAALSLTLLFTVGCASESIDDSAFSSESNLYWQRCALGASWDGVACVGDPATLDWATANDACAELGPGYRLPTLDEVGSLLGECSADGPAMCAPCLASSECSSVLADPDFFGWTWTADPTEAEGVFVVDLRNGMIAWDESSRTFHARCVTETP